MLGPLCVVSLVMSAAAYFWVMGVVFSAWNTPHTLLEGKKHEPSEEPRAPALARRLTIVVVDGLSFDHAARLEELEDLRSRGAFRQLESHYPTFTAPNITAMVTGLGPRESGVRLNGPGSGVPGIDDVAHAAWDEGIQLRVRSRTYAPFDTLSRAPPDADVKRGRLQPLFDWELDRARPAASEPADAATMLEMVYFGDVDEEGHRHGAASREYDEAARRAALFVERAAAELDPRRDLLFVLSDHGHRETGGHGGAEEAVARAFFLAWGRDVKGGATLPPRPMRDVASTIAMAVGSRTPSSNLGSPMVDLFDLDEASAALHMLEPFDQASRFGCSLEVTASCAEVDRIRSELVEGRGASDAMELVDRLGRERDASFREKEESGFTKRLLAGLVVAALFVALARARGYARPRDARGAAGPFVLSAVYVAVLAVLGYGPTMSTMKQAGLFFFDAVAAGTFAVIVTVVVGYLLRWNLAEAAFLLLAPFIALLPIWAAVGADSTALSPPVASVIVFLLTPIVPIAASAAIGVAVLDVRRGAAQAPSPA